jgi:uncharacterized protein (TIGR03437 family)
MLALAGTASAANPSLQLIISNETIPAGATGQVKVWVTSPTPIASGGFNIYFDPSIFTGIAGAGAFGADGNASAKVGIVATALGATFSSVGNAADIGRLPDLPVFTIDVTVSPGVAAGTKSTFSLDTTPAQWLDANGNTYSVTVVPGSVTVGGTLAISDVEPGGGILPAGTVVKVSGTGFDPAAALKVDGVSVGSVQVVGPQEIDFTIGAPAEMTGKRVAVANPDGSQAEYFPLLLGVAPDQTFYTFPLRTGTFLEVEPTAGPWIQNPNLYPINVTLITDWISAAGGGVAGTPTTLAPGQIMDLQGADYDAQNLVSSSGPMRDTTGGFGSPPSTEPSLPAIIDFAAAAGSTWALSQIVALYVSDPPSPDNISVSTESAGNWLRASVSATQTSVYAMQLVVTANPAGLAPGTYLGRITATVASATIPSVTGSATAVVRLDIISGGVTEVWQNPPYLDSSTVPTPYASSIPLDTNLFPAGANALVSTDGGGSWLSATYDPLQSSFSIVANPAAAGSGIFTGEVTLSGSGNTQIIPVFLNTGGPAVFQTAGTIIAVAQGPSGAANPSPQVINVINAPPGLTAAAATHSGGAWLNATPVSSSSVSVTIDASDLATGIYTGVVSLGATGIAGETQILVILTVLRGAQPELVAVPTVVNLSVPAGGMAGTGLTVDFGSGYPPIPFQAQITTTGSGNWLNLGRHSSLPSVGPGDLPVQVDASNLVPGIYQGSILITSYSQSLMVPVTLNVSPPAPPIGPPVVGSIVNAASAVLTALSPGEVITIYGTELGPTSAASLSLDAHGNVSTRLSGTQVLFGNVPAPLIYVSETQINAVVPYEVASAPVATVQVQYAPGGMSTPISVPIVPAVPGIFTISSNGQGAAAVLNEDNSVNSPANPAARGSVIQIYGTGAGQTSPTAATGSVAQGAASSVLPVQASVGGVDAQVQYAGSAPGFVNGVLQVNAIVPQQVTPGAAVPIVLMVGTTSSPARATISVQ